MRLKPSILLPLLGLGPADARFGSDKVPISSVKSLTLRSDQMTAGRRLDPIPQLTCVGGDAKVGPSKGRKEGRKLTSPGAHRASTRST